MLWGYDIAAKKLDLTAALREARQGGGLGDALEALQPPFPHYRRARRMAAIYRDLAKDGEPPTVPALATGVRKVEPGTTWTGVPQLAARLRAFGDLPARRRSPRPIRRSTAARSSTAVKRFQRRHGLEADGVIGPGTIRAAQRVAGGADSPDRAVDGADALAADAERSAQRLRERGAVPPVGHRSRPPARSRCA